MRDERRYTESELRAIIERAAERQEAVRRAEAKSESGLTLAELQEIGAASGIDPEHIASAAQDLAHVVPEAKPATLAGMPTALRQTRFVPADLSDDAWAGIVRDLRDTFDTNGVAGEVGTTREWTSQVRSKNGGAVHFRFEPADDGTHVTVEQSWRGSAWAFTGVSGGYAFAALVLGTLMAAGQLGDGDAFVPILFAAFAILMFGGSQIGMRLYANRQERRFERALDQIEKIMREDTTAATAKTQKAPEPRLDLDALPESLEAEPTTERTRTHS